MELIEIQYIFKFDNDQQETVSLKLDAHKLEIIKSGGVNFPAWANLQFHQCPHCPLSEDEHPYCPVAVSLADIVKRFDKILSYDKVDLEVVTTERKVSQHTTAQRGISSLLGVLFPVSGCPHTAFFKPMVRFHLPMATREETIFRATGMYLLAQYYLEMEGHSKDTELEGLTRIYKNLNVLNINIAERLRSATQTDSSINALILLDVFTQAMPFIIEDQLEAVRHLFSPYLSDFYHKIINSTDEEFDL